MSYVRGRVVSIKRWNNTLYSLIVEPPQPLAFTPGQYTKLAVEVDGELLARPYTITSAPGEDRLEFFLVEVNDGPLSHRLGRLSPGDELLIDSRAHGYLVLQETPQVADIWLLATGAGLAPFLSMLREGSIFSRHQRVALVQSVRYAADLAYAEELRVLTKCKSSLRHIRLVSRDTPPPGCLSGRITTRLAEGGLEQAAGMTLDKANSHLMLCGNPGMVEDTLRLLEERGMRRHRRRRPGQITLEKFW